MLLLGLLLLFLADSCEVMSAFTPLRCDKSSGSCIKSGNFNKDILVPFHRQAPVIPHQSLLAGIDSSTTDAINSHDGIVSAPKRPSVVTSFLFTISVLASLFSPITTFAADGGASVSSNAKITTGGASTLQSGRTIAITRGVNLDNADFGGQDLKGVAFQQSIVRDANFKGSNLVGSSFFDATVDGSDFEGADMTLANVEMAQFNRANLKNAVVRELYVSGATLFEGVKSIENSDWTDTYLRKDQKKYLCDHPTAKGVNPKTGVETRESLMCPD